MRDRRDRRHEPINRSRSPMHPEKKNPGNREKSKKKTYVTDPGQYSTTCSISAPCASRGLRMSKAASDRAKDIQIDMSAISLPGHTRRPNPNAKVRGSGAGAAPR